MQQCFLIYSQTYVNKGILLAVHGKEHKNDLRAILMSIPDPTMPDEKLFHSVNNMLMNDGIIFQFHPCNSNNACAFVDQLSKVVGKMTTIQLSQLDASKTPHTVAMIESDGITDNQTFDNNETANPLPRDVCGQQPDCLAYKICKAIFQDNPSSCSNCKLQMPTLTQCRNNYLQGQYLCTLFLSRYSLCCWLDSYISKAENSMGYVEILEWYHLL